MVEQVLKDVYRIDVPLPGNPLKALNSYFIKGKDEDFLIDTGFRMPEAEAALRAGLAEIGTDIDRINVINTHLHSDHTGLSNVFCGKDKKIMLGRKDSELLANAFKDFYDEWQMSRFVSEGTDPAIFKVMDDNNPAIRYRISEFDRRFTPLDPGDRIQAGNYELEVISVPGHTPGNTMLWLESEKVMFCGDHVLFDITPNITCWLNVEDSLGNYLDSLDKADSYPVELALPGHRKTGDYHERIATIKAHHQRRLAEAESLVRSLGAPCAYEVASRMTWKIRCNSWEEFPPGQKWFAIGECLSHMDYLTKRGRIERFRDGDKIRYRGL